MSTPSPVDAARTGAGLVHLANTAVISLENEDVRRWAHGMFTNHIKGLSPGQGNRNAMCDDRGRVGGLIDVYCVSEDTLLGVLDGVDTAWFAQRYKMFLILDDIELEELEEHTLLSLQGPAAAPLISALGLPLPEADHAHLLDEASGVRVIRKDRTGLGGFDLLVPAAGVDALQERAQAAGAVLLSEDDLDTLRILGGRARWPLDGSDKSMVHELRFNEEVCNFSKGCYVGQEVINRIDVKGAIQKRLTGVVLAADAVPQLPLEVSHEGSTVGQLTSAVAHNGRVLALGVLRKSVWAAGTPVLVDAEGAAIAGTVADLPFS